MSQPLIVTADERVLDEVLDVVLASGLEAQVARDVAAARRWWPEASLVIVGADLVQACAAAGWARRDGVVVAVCGLPPEGLWPAMLRLGAADCGVLPESREWLRTLVAEAERGAAWTVGVVGAVGGAGASTLAAALAVTAAREGQEPALVDLDPWGGGLDLLLGAEELPGVRWPDLAGATGRVARQTLVGSLPELDGVRVLAWARGSRGRGAVDPPAVGAVLDGLRQGSGLVVIDLPRDAATLMLAVPRAQAVVLVCPDRLRAIAAAGAVLAQLEGHPDVRLVVRRTTKEVSPADVAASLGVPLAGEIVDDPLRDQDESLGVPPAARSRSSLSRVAAGLLAVRETGSEVPARGLPSFASGRRRSAEPARHPA